MIPRQEAIQDGKYYYHPDCFHIRTVIKDIIEEFKTEINPLLTKAQIIQLYTVLYNIFFDKGVDADFVKFAVDYYAKYKKGALKYPAGINYIIQKDEVKDAWNRYKEAQIRDKLRRELEQTTSQQTTDSNNDYSLPDIQTIAPNKNKRGKFSSVIGG